jgi:hypothetical protein
VLGADVDRFRDFERAVLLDPDIADEAMDPLFSLGRRSGAEQQQAAEGPQDRGHG